MRDLRHEPPRKIGGSLCLGIIMSMSKLVRSAIEVLQNLPEDRQETIARAILDFGTQEEERE